MEQPAQRRHSPALAGCGPVALSVLGDSLHQHRRFVAERRIPLPLLGHGPCRCQRLRLHRPIALGARTAGIRPHDQRRIHLDRRSGTSDGLHPRHPPRAGPSFEVPGNPAAPLVERRYLRFRRDFLRRLAHQFRSVDGNVRYPVGPCGGAYQIPLTGGSLLRTRQSNIDHGLDRETLLDPLHQLVAHQTISLELFLAAFRFNNRRVEGIPKLDVAGHDPRQFHGLVLSLGRQGDHQIEEIVFQVVESLGTMAGNVDTDFVHHGDGETVDMPFTHAGAVDVDTMSVQEFQDPLRHGRADGIHGAGKKDGGREVGQIRGLLKP